MKVSLDWPTGGCLRQVSLYTSFLPYTYIPLSSVYLERDMSRDSCSLLSPSSVIRPCYYHPLFSFAHFTCPAFLPSRMSLAASPLTRTPLLPLPPLSHVPHSFLSLPSYVYLTPPSPSPLTRTPLLPLPPLLRIPHSSLSLPSHTYPTTPLPPLTHIPLLPFPPLTHTPLHSPLSHISHSSRSLPSHIPHSTPPSPLFPGQ